MNNVLVGVTLPLVFGNNSVITLDRTVGGRSWRWRGEGEGGRGREEVYHHLDVVITGIPSEFVVIVTHTKAYFIFCWFVLWRYNYLIPLID
jgi:hypothetical protein